MYLYPPERLIDARVAAVCGRRMTEQRFTAAELPQSGAHVAVHAYTVEAHRSFPCYD